MVSSLHPFLLTYSMSALPPPCPATSVRLATSAAREHVTCTELPRDLRQSPDCCRSAVPVGFVIFVVSWITLIVIRFGFPFDSRYSSAVKVVFALMPWALLGKGLQDLAFAAGEMQAHVVLASHDKGE